MANNNNLLEFSVAHIDETRRIIFGEVYAPNKIDAYGWFMEPKEVEKMAHKFMRLDLNKVIDTNHDNIPNGSYPVQSFIAREGDPQFTEGAWVLGVKITNEKLWQEVVAGKLNAFSMEIFVKKVPAIVEVETLTKQVGRTEESEDHEHYFYAEIDPSTGRVVGGRTNKVNGHEHILSVNSVTDESVDDKLKTHSHRYFLGN